LTSSTQRKRELRRQAETARGAAYEATDPQAAAAAARDRILALDAVARASCISAFWSVGTELDTGPLIRALADRGTAVGLPVVAAKAQPLVFRRWQPDMVLVPGVHDIPVPPEDAAVVVPEVLIVPLLAFDRQGYRLGYGGGFYDRTLEALRGQGRAVTAVGFAFAAQEVDSVPRESFDQPLDFIVTEAETIEPVAAMTAD
jgi:5-formyltetrahydrofolate cyclo-ligase